MNLKGLRELIGKEVRLRPRPKTANGDLRETENRWLIIDEVEDGKFLLKHYRSNHKVLLSKDQIQEFLSPNFLILRSYVTLLDGGRVELEPMGPGLSDPDSIEELTEQTSLPHRDRIYEELKTHVGKPITVRFSGEDSSGYHPVEVILEKCTPNFVTVCRPQITIRTAEWMGDTELPPIPEHKASIPLARIDLAEDVEEHRPLIVFDHSFWGSEPPRPRIRSLG